MLRLLIVCLMGYMMLSCSDSGGASGQNRESAQATIPSARWYSKQQVEDGSTIFEKHCSECHGQKAEGKVANWKQKLKDGSFPPPPLNGSAHAWHHSQSVLLGVINVGGDAYGGKMPAFEDVLEKEEKLAVIAYFQNFWDEEIYRKWEVMDGAR